MSANGADAAVVEAAMMGTVREQLGEHPMTPSALGHNRLLLPMLDVLLHRDVTGAGPASIDA
jgi:hypothetical protein